MAICGSSTFKEIFPKTFAYLEFAVPVIHPEYLEKEIPNPLVIIKDKEWRGNSGFGELETRGFFRKRVEVIIYLEGVFNYLTEIPFSKAQQKYNFKDPKILAMFCRYFDTQPRFQHALIHEYEHVLQGPVLERRHLEFAHTQLGLEDVRDLNIFQFLKKEVFAPRLGDESIRFFLSWYRLAPREVEARLTQWVFLKFKGYDDATIAKMEMSVPNDLEKMRADYQAICEELVSIDTGEKRNRRKVADLTYKKKTFEMFLEVYPKIIEHAERIAEVLRTKYEHAKVV